MKKKVTKITTESTYDEKGRVIKEVETIEEYEVDTTHTCVCGCTIKAGTISAKDIVDGTFKKAKGIPYDSTFVTSDPNLFAKADIDGNVTVNGNLELPDKTMSDIVNKVRIAVSKSLDEQLKRNKPF